MTLNALQSTLITSLGVSSETALVIIHYSILRNPKRSNKLIH